MTSATSRVDLKALAEFLGIKKLGFASPERLKEYLAVEPGSVTVLALTNDPSHSVELLVDCQLWNEELLGCHPLVNTSTTSGSDPYALGT